MGSGSMRPPKHSYYMDIVKKKKIGLSPINIDCDSIEDAIKAAKRILSLGLEAEWRFSSSGKGIHFRIVKNGKPVYAETLKSLEIRAELGDDPHRIFWDLIRYYNDFGIIGRLFDTKNGKRAGEWKKLDESAISFFEKLVVDVSDRDHE